jgi:hypothetical protein
MALAEFIRSKEEAIVAEWDAFAQAYLPSAAHMDRSARRDHIVGLLRFIANDLETSIQTTVTPCGSRPGLSVNSRTRLSASRPGADSNTIDSAA